MIEKIKASFFGNTEIYAWMDANIFSHIKFDIILIGVICLALLHSGIIGKISGLIKVKISSFLALVVIEKVVDCIIKATVIISGFFVALDPMKFFSNLKNPLPWEFFNFIETKTALWAINLISSGFVLFFFSVLLSIFIGIVYWIIFGEKQIMRNSWDILKSMLRYAMYVFIAYWALMFIIFITVKLAG